VNVFLGAVQEGRTGTNLLAFGDEFAFLNLDVEMYRGEKIGKKTI